MGRYYAQFFCYGFFLIIINCAINPRDPNTINICPKIIGVLSPYETPLATCPKPDAMAPAKITIEIAISII